uniref:Uncharacterized protein n=1 Tax=Rhizophagus irregularis (strain DAOM 181602 / DAOM 197198 / MUCL 43194) TaxID=747089 RepID=U9UFW8_RHIID
MPIFNFKTKKSMTRRSSWFRNLLWEFKFTEIETVIELTLSVIGCYSKIIIIKKVLSEDVLSPILFSLINFICDSHREEVMNLRRPNYSYLNLRHLQFWHGMTSDNSSFRKCDHIGPTLHYANCESLLENIVILNFCYGDDQNEGEKEEKD